MFQIGGGGVEGSKIHLRRPESKAKLVESVTTIQQNITTRKDLHRMRCSHGLIPADEFPHVSITDDDFLGMQYPMMSTSNDDVDFLGMQ